jgi:hypothetical protein
MHPAAKTARLAGATYLATLPLAIYFWVYIPDKLIVRANPAATAEKILAHEQLFRFSIWGDLFAYVIVVCVAFLLYHLLYEVNKTWALMMVGFALLSAAVGFFSGLQKLAALILFRGGDFLGALDKSQRDAFAMFFLRLHGQGDLTNHFFSALWLFPMGALVFRSRFLPRFLGVWLIAAGVGWLTLSVVGLVFPASYDRAFGITQPIVLGEMVFALWLLVRGVNVRAVAQTT